MSRKPRSVYLKKKKERKKKTPTNPTCNCMQFHETLLWTLAQFPLPWIFDVLNYINFNLMDKYLLVLSTYK